MRIWDEKFINDYDKSLANYADEFVKTRKKINELEASIVGKVFEVTEALLEKWLDMGEKKFQSFYKMVKPVFNDDGKMVGECGYFKSSVRDSQSGIWSFGSYITSRSRTRIYEYAQDCIYSDTDSIYVPTGYPVETGKELGDWVHEKDLAWMRINGKKWYDGLDTSGNYFAKSKGVGIPKDDNGDPLFCLIDMNNPPAFRKMIHAKESLRRGLTAGEFVYIKKKLKEFDDEYVPYNLPELENIMEWDIPETAKAMVHVDMINAIERIKERHPEPTRANVIQTFPDAYQVNMTKAHTQMTLDGKIKAVDGRKKWMSDYYDETLTPAENIHLTEIEDIMAGNQ